MRHTIEPKELKIVYWIPEIAKLRQQHEKESLGYVQELKGHVKK